MISKYTVSRTISRLLILLLMAMFNCITPFEPDAKFTGVQLTIDGIITDQPGLHKVRLYYSLAASNLNFFPSQFPVDATVSILDDLGNQEALKYTSNGYFVSQAVTLQGTVGRSYFLKIVMSDGTTYQSLPELLKPVPRIDTVNVLFQQLPPGQNSTAGQFNVSINTRDPETKGDYYRWRWEHYELRSYCSDTSISTGGPPLWIYYPCCKGLRSWSITSCETCINLLSDQFINGREITNQYILSAPYDATSPYFVAIYQQSLTESAYKFWTTLNEQVSNTGGIFDKPPATVPGNIINVTNPKDQALGFFGASSLVIKPFIVKRDNVGIPPNLVTQIPITLDSACRSSQENYYVTGVAPPGWN